MLSLLPAASSHDFPANSEVIIDEPPTTWLTTSLAFQSVQGDCASHWSPLTFAANARIASMACERSAPRTSMGGVASVVMCPPNIKMAPV